MALPVAPLSTLKCAPARLSGQATVAAQRHVAGVFLLNILKRLDSAQLERLELALADLNAAAADARHEAPAS